MSKHEFSISVLLPTRGRTEALKRSVVSLFNRVTGKEKVQLMLGFDSDDTEGIANFNTDIKPWLDEKKVAYTAMVFDPMGYTRLNEYVNALAAASDADWLFFWNDDAIMETTGWNKTIASHTGEFKCLAVHTHREHPYSIFPIVPAEWFDLLGYLSPHQISDCWLSQQAYALDIWQRIDVWVTHDRFDLTGNNNDTTFQKRVMYEGNQNDPRDIHHPQWMSRRFADADKIAEYMESRGLSTQWYKDSKAGKINMYQKMHENDINKFLGGTR